MNRLFISIYHLFSRFRVIAFSFLILVILLLAYASSNVRFEEDFTQFFPQESASAKSAELFSRIKIKDKIVILFCNKDSLNILPPERMIIAATSFENKIKKEVGYHLIKESRLKIDDGEKEHLMDFVYGNLPIFLSEKDYQIFDSLSSHSSIDLSLQRALSSLLSPAGVTISSYYEKDPIGIASSVLESLKSLQSGMEYNFLDNHLFSVDNSVLLYVVTPKFGSSNTAENEKLIWAIETAKKELEANYPKIEVQFMGGPAVGIYNARQIKKDTFITLTIALIIIVSFLFMAFRKFSSILLLLLPAFFGVLFALAFISLDASGVSAIAIGAGATVMGIALSYSIHILSHLKHVKSIEQLIEELSYPLIVGNFTTVGAFLGLLFTQSPLLQDFGLFSALTLIGTTLFCLIFMPLFLKVPEKEKSNRVIEWIEKFTSYRFEKNRWLISIVVLLFGLGVVFSSKVRFESDMMKLNYEPESILKAQNTFRNKFKSNESRILLLSNGGDLNSAISTYNQCDSALNLLQENGVEISSTSVSKFLVSESCQIERIKRWNKYWNKDKINNFIANLNNRALSYGFDSTAFKEFETILRKNYSVTLYDGNSNLPGVFTEWMEETDSSSFLITQVFIKEKDKPFVYDKLLENKEIVVIDRAHFAGIWATAIKEDFYFILFLCSFLVFGTLLISYGRLELAIIAFVPMMVSWLIILGLMAIFQIPFNIVNILLSTFIFGIGDDFSIFVLDGLQSEFSRKKMILSSHKSAIFFSTFTVIVGMGALVFAKHPALHSISLISVVGMVAVWGVAHTIQPILYRFFITSQTDRGLPPYTLVGIILMLFTFSVFVISCAIASIYISLVILLPLPKRMKRETFHKLIKLVAFIPVRLSPTVRIFKENPFKEEFKKPAIIIANHQSFIDILMMLSLSPKIIMMTNGWVWNSPIFGHIVRYAGFLYYKDGLERHFDEVKKRVAQGYSILIFPEGTRSADMNIHRFHKGAFALANELSIDILPILIYGNGNLVSKQQPFYVKQGIIGYRILPRIAPDNREYSGDCRAKSKLIVRYMREEYATLRSRYDSPENQFFYYAVLANYIYKGPVLEWYMRIKIRMENNYNFFHDIIPLKASVTDVGCGYGPLCFMLGLLSKEREILGIDYDNEKIEIATNCYSASDNINFMHANALDCDFPMSNVFILNDVLHYMSLSDQENLLLKCASKLQKDGIILIRDADRGNIKDHRVTKLTEWFSIDLLGFNKATQAPCFTDSNQFKTWADKMGCSLEVRRNDKITSNTIYLLKKIESNE